MKEEVACTWERMRGAQKPKLKGAGTVTKRK